MAQEMTKQDELSNVGTHGEYIKQILDKGVYLQDKSKAIILFIAKLVEAQTHYVEATGLDQDEQNCDLVVRRSNELYDTLIDELNSRIFDSVYDGIMNKNRKYNGF